MRDILLEDFERCEHFDCLWTINDFSSLVSQLGVRSYPIQPKGPLGVRTAELRSFPGYARICGRRQAEVGVRLGFGRVGSAERRGEQASWGFGDLRQAKEAGCLFTAAG